MTVEQEDSDLAEQARDWVIRLASGEATGDDLAALRAWLGRSPRHARAFAAERDFWQRIGPLQATFERLEREEAGPAAAEGVTWLPFRRRLRAVVSTAAALAACLMLLAFAPEFGIALRADYRSGAEGIRSVTLPDGSRVTLDRNAAIAFQADAARREVELLAGEAFFEVTPDSARPFRVLAGGGVSEALGTAFAVRLGAGGARVAVTEGRVAVSAAAAAGASRHLQAGQALHYSEAGVLGATEALEVGRTLAWRQGRVVLVGRPLSEALAELERYHPGRIVLLADVPSAEVSGVIDLDRLDDGIAALAATHGLATHRLTPYLTVLR